MTFDMTTYRRLSEKLEIDDIDFGAFHERPLGSRGSPLPSLHA